jgi:polysaccharide biosynthesis transport protein
LEDEIDLRQYILVLVRYWKWIVGGAVLAAVAAFLISLALPTTYEATAIITITRPPYLLQFDSRVLTVGNAIPIYRAYPELATSDDVLQILAGRLDSPGNKYNLETLKRRTKAVAGSDLSLLRLSVRAESPHEAAYLVNLWADLFVTQANQRFGVNSEQHLQFFEDQLSQSYLEMEIVQQRLIDFQAGNRIGLIETYLTAHTEGQLEYLAEQRKVVALIREIEGFRQQLGYHSPQAQLTQTDRLTALFLQMKVFEIEQIAVLQIQLEEVIASNGNDSLTVSQQIDRLDSMILFLEAKSLDIATRLAAIEPEILQMQREHEAFKVHEQQLTSALNIREETYKTVARKVEEARIAAQDETGEVQLASYAAVPSQPVAPRKVINTAVAALFGFMITIVAVFSIGWWQQEATNEIRWQEATKHAGEQQS